MEISSPNTKRKGTLPNLVIIGAAKCGTTSLHYYLGLHPQIFMSREKELNFFNSRFNWRKGVEWYASHFTGNAEIYGESSVGYTNHPFSGGVPVRMFSVIPEVKIIYILRDPIDRIISSYFHNYADRIEERAIEVALKPFPTSAYVAGSVYYLQIEQYLKYFASDNILIITLEDLHKDRKETLKKIFRFLGVDETFDSAKFMDIKHRSEYKRRKGRFGMLLKVMAETRAGRLVSADVRRNIGRVLYMPFSEKNEKPVFSERLRSELIDYLKADVDLLRQYTGRSFKNWDV